MKAPTSTILSPSLVLALSLAGCGSVDSDSDDSGGDGDRGADAGVDSEDDADPDTDVDPPTVLSVSPADGAGGVASDAVITVAFSQAMDADSVEAAWSSEELAAVDVTFSWNPAGDTFTVTPVDPLPVAEGSGDDPDAVEALTIGFAIGTGATDLDGARLAEPFESEFATLRRLVLELPPHGPLTDSRVSTNAGAPGGSAVLYAGDTSDNLQVKMLVSFALPELVANAVLEAASLSANQTSATTNIYSLFGDLEAVRVRFAQITSAFGAGSLGSVGIFSDSATLGERTLSVTSAVADDLGDGVDYSQFRLEFPIPHNDDDGFDTAQFSKDSFSLTLTYLVE